MRTLAIATILEETGQCMARGSLDACAHLHSIEDQEFRLVPHKGVAPSPSHLRQTVRPKCQRQPNLADIFTGDHTDRCNG
jgi:hypothetical protein